MKLDAGSAIPDGKLLDGIAKGDRVAFTEFYQRHNRSLFAFLVKMVRDRELAEEVLSETMLDVWRQAGRFEGKSSVTTWLFSIGHHKAVSRLRRMREVALDEEVAANIEDSGPTPDMQASDKDMSRLLARLIECLSLDHREILQLAYYQEFSVQEIAEVLDLPENTVKTRMFYARQRLKALLEQAGVKGAVA
ncbi:sigma-70 family RNA polymerase sigma factor [Dongia rigui]|uniref:Sigma-70 family RNA polymerase sigma factor n=1 Tax=Dongia rigui TaxID=940149 RepID=A0ABU5E1B8_9PROT|nr:sigma-70 family RNA polymerase sigma factor [Dongia rigui]MDY0873019.1 sigma-70 family RNA polymerase sigma factor [Dongia rigui]